MELLSIDVDVETPGRVMIVENTLMTYRCSKLVTALCEMSLFPRRFVTRLCQRIRTLNVNLPDERNLDLCSLCKPSLTYVIGDVACSCYVKCEFAMH